MRRDAAATLSAWEGRQPKSQANMMEAYTRLAGSTGGMDSCARLKLVALMELGCAIVEVGVLPAGAGQCHAQDSLRGSG